MKYRNEYFNNEKNKEQEWKREHKAGGFKCAHCKQWTAINSYMGTVNRNHCNLCLWSKHVDKNKGDRAADCQGGMRPIGLTFKHEGYGKQGELMLVHACVRCVKISINRIARDDDETSIVEVFEKSTYLSQSPEGIKLLSAHDKPEVYRQLFGTRAS